MPIYISDFFFFWRSKTFLNFKTNFERTSNIQTSLRPCNGRYPKIFLFEPRSVNTIYSSTTEDECEHRKRITMKVTLPNVCFSERVRMLTGMTAQQYNEYCHDVTQLLPSTYLPFDLIRSFFSWFIYGKLLWITLEFKPWITLIQLRILRLNVRVIIQFEL